MDRQAGFTLIETLVGAAIGVLLVVGRAGLRRPDGRPGRNAANQRVNAVAGAGRLVERMSSEAASAMAVYVPATDALGQSNTDGHEVDFFTEDGAHRTYAWAYTFRRGCENGHALRARSRERRDRRGYARRHR